jgi:predicted transcriptional regulator
MAAMSARTGIKRSLLSCWQRGQKELSEEQISAIARVIHEETWRRSQDGLQPKGANVLASIVERGREMRELRLKWGIMQKELSEASGISDYWICMFERGHVAFSLDAVTRLGDALEAAINKRRSQLSWYQNPLKLQRRRESVGVSRARLARHINKPESWLLDVEVGNVPLEGAVATLIWEYISSIEREQGKITELRAALSAPVKIETPPEPPLTTHKKAKLEALVKKVAVQAEKIQLLEKSLNIAERINNTDCERAALLHWQVTELEERLTAMEGMVCRMPPSAERDELARVLHAAQEEVVNGYLPPPSLPGPEGRQAEAYAGPSDFCDGQQAPSVAPGKGAASPVTRVVAGVAGAQPPSGGPEAGSGQISGRLEDEAISHVCKHRIRKR